MDFFLMVWDFGMVRLGNPLELEFRYPAEGIWLKHCSSLIPPWSLLGDFNSWIQSPAPNGWLNGRMVNGIAWVFHPEPLGRAYPFDWIHSTMSCTYSVLARLPGLLL